MNTSGYLLVLILGSFIGYLTSAYLTDRIGRRRCFMLFACSAGVLVVTYTQIPITDSLMLLLGFPLGFFLSGIFSGMGAYLSELFPSRVRGSGQGFCYNVGRGIGSIAPALVGYMSATIPLGIAIGYFAAGAYLLVVLTAAYLGFNLCCCGVPDLCWPRVGVHRPSGESGLSGTTGLRERRERGQAHHALVRSTAMAGLHRRVQASDPHTLSALIGAGGDGELSTFAGQGNHRQGHAGGSSARTSHHATRRECIEPGAFRS
jgi:MFS family permease